MNDLQRTIDAAWEAAQRCRPSTAVRALREAVRPARDRTRCGPGRSPKSSMANGQSASG
jgi:hypothetical protein